MTKQAIILAGGKGTRLKEVLGDLPKPMIPISGKPLLEHQINLAREHGFTDLLFFVHHQAEFIQEFFGDGKKWGVNIRYVLEKEPLGTCGAVFAGMEHLAPRFLVLYGDTMVNVDLGRLWRWHEDHSADASLLLHPNDHPLDSDLVEIADSGEVLAFHNRPHAPGVWRQNLVNAGLYVLNRDALLPFKEQHGRTPELPSLCDFGKHLFPAMLKRGARLLGYNSPEFIKDIGTPERYARVQAQYTSGVVAQSTLAAPQRAVFLDRDGTIIPDKDCLRRPEDLELFPNAAEAIRKLNHAGWRTILVTNQPVIAKGWCTEAELKTIHNKLETLLGEGHAFLDRIYYCPHHPEGGFPGERADLKRKCDCRKPAAGMVEKACAELNVDPARSWMIGDTTTDMQLAQNAGLKSILVGTGAAGKDGKYTVSPNHSCNDLNQAVDLILSATQNA